MATWESWFNDIMPQAPGALAAIVKHELLRTAQDFFSRSRVWKEDVTLAMTAGTSDYSIRPAADLAPVQVIDTGRITVSLTDEEMTERFGPDWRAAVGPVQAIWQKMPDKIRTYPIPASAESLVLSVAVMPADSATGIPDALAERYRDGIAAGTLSRLLLSAKKPYTDLQTGSLKAQEYEASVGAAISDRAYGFGRTRGRRRHHWC